MRRTACRCLALGLCLLAACRAADPPEARRHLEQLCSAQQLREQYLDFYWDDLRSHQPELWAEALRTCTEACPSSVNCAPVLSVASWYRQPTAAADPSITERSPQ